MAMSVRVRRAQVAGLFYPDDPKELQATVEGLLAAASVPAEVHTERLRALIVPHAGYAYSGPVAAVGYKLLQLQHLRSSKSLKVLLLGPAHFVAFSGAATHPADLWETPLGRVPVVNPGVPLDERGPLIVLAEAHEREHSLEVQLPFLQVALEAFEIFPLVTGLIRAETLAQALGSALERFDLIIVSSDLSHYHPDARAREIDAMAHRVITELDVEGAEQRLDACGKTAICALLRWAKARGWRAELLDYKTSGNTAGDPSSVVGYGCYSFFS
jgi:hypothetical protein